MADHSDNSDIEIVPPPKKKHTSWVWDHFRKTENNTKGECNYCDKVFTIGVSAATGKDKGTKSLSDHLKSKHSMEPSVAVGMQANNQLQESKKTKQQKIKELIVSRNQVPLPSNSDRAITIQRGILEMIAVHNRPFCIVEDCMLLFVFHLLCMGLPWKGFFPHHPA